jgi:peptidoglycan hydrolase-like amidase
MLFEAGAILFFGSLVSSPELIRCGAEALQELKALGYTIPTGSEPVRVYPAKTGGTMSAAHAGGWRPGVITIREHPVGGLGPDVYLRHELMHEAVFRTCGGKLPLWAQEAAAIRFSGELAFRPFPESITGDQLMRLQNRVRIGAPLDHNTYRTLSDLIVLHEWPLKPCAVSDDISEMLTRRGDVRQAGFSYILISLVSGRILDSRGDVYAKSPPGSLLKIPYAASLRHAHPEEISRELAVSDTRKLLKRNNDSDAGLYRFFISGIQEQSLAGRLCLPEEDDAHWLPRLGERASDGLFPLEADLYELALMLRASVLYRPEYFVRLSENGFFEGSTLYQESEKDKKILAKLFAMTKTGTVSDSTGNPLSGHLMASWPADSPKYLAVFRTGGSNGASNIRRASAVLEKWSKQHPAETGNVSVRLLSLIPWDSWRIADKDQALEKKASDGRTLLISSSGDFAILSSAKGSRRERIVSGILKIDAENQTLVLETDPETYADAVIRAEADNLKGEAAKAMRAVIVWNALHGTRRHPETASLCDTTHCMVFMGTRPDETAGSGRQTDPKVYAFLNNLAFTSRLNWLMFSKGGDDRWQRRYPFSEMNRLAGEQNVLEIRRERTRTGQIRIHLMYPENHETVPCDVFKIKIGLPSCPDTVRRDDKNRQWRFEGVGQGHGQGLSVLRAKALGEAGHDAKYILKDAYDVENE